MGAVRDEGLKNFLTVVTFRVFSLVFFSSNLEKDPSEACPGCACGAVDWEWDWAPWLLAYAASSSRCNLEPEDLFLKLCSNTPQGRSEMFSTQEGKLLLLHHDAAADGLTFLPRPSRPGSVSAVPAGTPPSSTWSTGPANPRCRSNRIPFCTVGPTGPRGSRLVAPPADS